ncbi:membrane protein YczE [Brachybacterium alimentarium]|uniref:membrane protein YczE n=1 Tax=Brachybacterium alimentarium TaxID=47845 RepID=UPI003FD4F88F
MAVPPPAGDRTLSNLSLRDQLRVDRLPLRLLQMLVGLTGFGFSLAMLLRSGLGGAPWDVLHAALAERAGLTVGTLSIAVSFVVLLLWIPLREQAGIGTVANAIWVGVSIDLGMLVLPPVQGLPMALLLMIVGVLVNGVSAAIYIGAQLGPGARDGLMTGLARRLRRPVGPVRICLEVLVLAIGWGLGGPVGVGTLLYAVGLGPVIQLALPRVIMPVRRPVRAPSAHRDAAATEPPADPA